MNALSGCFAIVMARYLNHEEERRKKYLDSLPDEKREVVMRAMAERAAADEKHQREVEIAEAGRPRNFWGR